MNPFVILFRRGPDFPATDADNRRRAAATGVWARSLNAAGHRTSRGLPFNGESVRQWLSRRRPALRHRPPPPMKEHEWTATELARRLGVSDRTVWSWVRRGRLRARHSDEPLRRLIVHADETELNDLIAHLKAWRKPDVAAASSVSRSAL